MVPLVSTKAEAGMLGRCQDHIQPGSVEEGGYLHGIKQDTVEVLILSANIFCDHMSDFDLPIQLPLVW